MFVEIGSGRWSQSLVAQVLTRHCRVEPSLNETELPRLFASPPPSRNSPERSDRSLECKRPAISILQAALWPGMQQSRPVRSSAVLIDQPRVPAGVRKAPEWPRHDACRAYIRVDAVVVLGLAGRTPQGELWTARL